MKTELKADEIHGRPRLLKIHSGSSNRFFTKKRRGVNQRKMVTAQQRISVTEHPPGKGQLGTEKKEDSGTKGRVGSKWNIGEGERGNETYHTADKRGEREQKEEERGRCLEALSR